MKTATGTNAERRSIPRRRGTRVQTDKNAWPPVFSPLPPPSFALESVVQQTEAAFPLQLAPKKKRSVWKKGHVHCNRLSSLFFFFFSFFPRSPNFQSKFRNGAAIFLVPRFGGKFDLNSRDYEFENYIY